MKHFNEILATIGATDIACLEDTQDWSFWQATYRTPVSRVSGNYLYLKHKCPLREASAANLARWMLLSKKQGYTVVATPASPLASNMANTKATFAGNGIYTSKELLVENFLKDFHPRPILQQDCFIDPDIQLEDGRTEHNATSYLAAWIRGEAKTVKDTPLAVLVADGGVGKTTVSRVLCHNLHKKDPHTIPILVESDQWKSLLQSTMTMDTLWDLALSRRFEHAGRLLADSTTLRVLVREGLFAVIFDGFDELCVVPGSQFQAHDVVSNLLQMVTPEDEIQRARVILTTRYTYWQSIEDDIDLSKLEVFRIKGFDNEQRKRYFLARLPDPAERDLAFRLSKQIGGSIYDSIPKDDVNENRPSGVPFILDLIAQYVHRNPDARPNPYQADPFQSLLTDVCARENKRQTLGIDPATQFDIFEEMFRGHAGGISVDDIRFYLDCVAGVTDESVVKSFTSHVFLAPAGASGFSPKYEVLRVYFIARFLAQSLVSTTKRGSRAAVAKILAANKTGKTQVIDWLVDQLRRMDDQLRLNAIRHAIEIISDKENRDVQKSSAAALLHLVTKLLPSQDRRDRTAQLLHYIDAPLVGDARRITTMAFVGSVKSFDFSDVEFVHCWFDSVEFKGCRFTAKTQFIGCTFDGTVEFSSCEGFCDAATRDCTLSPEAEYALDQIKSTGVSEKTKRAFAEDALSRALKKFKGSYGLDGFQYRHRKNGFKSGNPYNEAIWDVLAHQGIIARHTISNVAEGGLNIVEDSDVRREVLFFFDNGVFGRRLQAVLHELAK